MDKKNNRIAIISRESDNKTLDIELLEKELKIRGLEVTVLCKLLTKEKTIRALGYVRHILKQELAIIKSDIVILDTYCIPASLLPHRKKTKIIQMWHALAAIKKFGWQTVGKAGGSSERIAKLMKMHKGYDSIITTSDITAKYYCEAFRIGAEKIVKAGLPRIDYIQSVSHGDLREITRARIVSVYPVFACSEKKTILYAPTFRRGKAVDVNSLIDSLDFEKYRLVVKLHPIYKVESNERKKDINNANFDVIYDESFSSFDWLSVSDIIISDYSSFVVESSLTEKPLYIYAYDLEEYKSKVGLNMNFENEPISKYVFKNADDLSSALADNYDFNALSEFRNRYIDINTDNCTSALADYIESLME